MKLSYETYKDKVLAGWIGKSIGGVIGAPLENHKELKDLSLDALWPAHLAANDDLDLQVVWLEAMQERGLDLTSDDLADFWRDRCWYSFCEYGVFLNNVQRGIAPPLSGTWNNDYFWESEGCPIRSDIWGFVAPGNPQLAADLAKLDGQLDHGGTSVLLEQFLAAASAQSLFCDDLETALAAGLTVVPPESNVARAVSRVRQIGQEYSDSRQAWRVVVREFGDRDASKGISNHALVLLALFHGKGDFKRTLQLCANFGWDTDCTASTAGALLGSLGGTQGLPADWVERIGTRLICGINAKHANVTLEEFAEDTCKIGVEMSKIRNRQVEIVGGPCVVVRPRRPPELSVRIEYSDEPVLWNVRASEVIVHLENPLSIARTGALQIVTPNGMTARYEDSGVTVAACGRHSIRVEIQRQNASGWLADKNLFCARWVDAGQTIAERTFGLGGARQWQIYGPYWDMWDKTKNEVCPYSNSEFVGGPYSRSLTGDCYNQYARLEQRYLDEARLLREDIFEEAPMSLEKGTDHFQTRDFGGFNGQACYYLVRTLRGEHPCGQTLLTFGRSGPFRVWLDGEELGSKNDMRGCTQLDDDNFPMPLDGKSRRLVVKLIRQSDNFAFSLFCMGPGDPEYRRGISNLLDCMEDLPNP